MRQIHGRIEEPIQTTSNSTLDAQKATTVSLRITSCKDGCTSPEWAAFSSASKSWCTLWMSLSPPGFTLVTTLTCQVSWSLALSPTNLHWATARMDHKPILHYRVLQLGLPLMFNLLTGRTNSQTEKLKNTFSSSVNVDNPFSINNASRIPTCKDDFHLPGVDGLIITEEVVVQHLQWNSVAKIYVGNQSNPSDFLVCDVSLNQCLPMSFQAGCYCTYLSRDQSRRYKYMVYVFMFLAWGMSDQSVYMMYTPQVPGAETSTLFIKPIPKIMDKKPSITLTVNGQSYDVTDHNCPHFKPALRATVRFCAENLQNPRITMHLDDVHSFAFSKNCGNTTVTLTAEHAGKPFWFTYSDTCKRHGTILCRYQSGASNLPVTRVLLGVLSLSNLLVFKT